MVCEQNGHGGKYIGTVEAADGTVLSSAAFAPRENPRIADSCCVVEKIQAAGGIVCRNLSVG